MTQAMKSNFELRCIISMRITPELLRHKVNNTKEWFDNPDNGISLATAKRWLNLLKWTRSRTRPGLYNDGHESEDVVAHRKKFVEEMVEIKRRMKKYPDYVPNGLVEGERPLIFYTHDEASFHSNDGQRYMYHPEGEMELYKKRNGATIMVSELLSMTDDSIKDVCESIHIDKTHDGYWDGEKLALQFERLIECHVKTYPDCDAVVAFDNATSHQVSKSQ
ncbi:hypothetical protein B0O80DRAFT_502128 [Mortierella sp. GBAus27b]|nr:hypothetical protein B0O80DRAFT_502128 [Mortierella sp. GBAus27b]